MRAKLVRLRAVASLARLVRVDNRRQPLVSLRPLARGPLVHAHQFVLWSSYDPEIVRSLAHRSRCASADVDSLERRRSPHAPRLR